MQVDDFGKKQAHGCLTIQANSLVECGMIRHCHSYLSLDVAVRRDIATFAQ